MTPGVLRSDTAVMAVPRRGHRRYLPTCRIPELPGHGEVRWVKAGRVAVGAEAEAAAEKLSR